MNVSEYEINDILLDGEVLYLVVNQGVIKTSLDLLDHTDVQPRMHINKLITPEAEFKPDVEIILSHNDNEVKIEYSILDFGKSIPTALFYRINESQWVKTSSLSRELTFPKLEAGKYKIDFKFKEGQLLDSVVFTIKKPWWEQWWFISSIVLSISSLVYLYYQHRMKILSVKNKLLEENVQLEKNLRHSLLTTIKSQMNPHFLYNALNTIQAYIYVNDKENAGKYLIKFSKLTRKVLEMSEMESVALNEELETIQLYLDLEKARFSDDFRMIVETSGLENLEDIKVPPMLIQSYIENAVKHGLLHKQGEKMLKITFQQLHDVLKVVIDDNGVGRQRSAELNKIKTKNHKSFASEANAKRLEVLNHGRNKKFTVVYFDKIDALGHAAGTTVEINIPLNNPIQ